MSIHIEVTRVGDEDDAQPLPERATRDSAGVDLRSAASCALTLRPGRRTLVPTGLKMAIPHGFFGAVCSRSGLALKYGVTVLNSPGIIDSDYRGEVKVILCNHDHHDSFVIEPGDRIAQFLLIKQTDIGWKPWGNYAEETTIRGEGGGGSTGMR